MALQTPVVLIGFNRPDHTRRVIERIAAVRPQRLLLVADGPRATHPEEAARCEEVRSIMTSVRWPCDVSTNFSDVNLGVKRRIASGLDWVFMQADEAIILEDDCVPHESFFPFCEELLHRYRDDPRVHMISGANYTPGRRFTGDSYYFSRWYHVWGWATWARAWRRFDVDMTAWPGMRSGDWLERFLPDPRMPAVARLLFDQTHSGRRDAWDYPWVLSGWLQNALAIVPAVNLVSNIGFGAAATTTIDSRDPLARLPAAGLEFPLRHPASVEVLERADLYEWKLLNPDLVGLGGLWRRARRRVRGAARRWLGWAT